MQSPIKQRNLIVLADNGRKYMLDQKYVGGTTVNGVFIPEYDLNKGLDSPLEGEVNTYLSIDKEGINIGTQVNLHGPEIRYEKEITPNVKVGGSARAIDIEGNAKLQINFKGRNNFNVGGKANLVSLEGGGSINHNGVLHTGTLEGGFGVRREVSVGKGGSIRVGGGTGINGGIEYEAIPVKQSDEEHEDDKKK